MTTEQQCKALGLLKRALVVAPFQIIERPDTPKSLGNEIEEFLHEVAEKESAQ